MKTFHTTLFLLLPLLFFASSVPLLLPTHLRWKQHPNQPLAPLQSLGLLEISYIHKCTYWFEQLTFTLSLYSPWTVFIGSSPGIINRHSFKPSS